MKSIVPVVVLILLISPTLTDILTDDDDDDDIDPFDMLNFDHASMSMENKKVKKDTSIDVDNRVENSIIDKKKTNDGKKEKNGRKKEKEPKPPEINIEIPHESLSKDKTPSVDPPTFDLRKCPIKKSPASPLFRQFVKSFLNHISKKVVYSGEYDMRLRLTIEDIEILKRYGDSETEVDIYTAHTILTGMIYNFREVSTGDKSGHRLWIEEQLGFPLEKLVQMVIVVVLMAGICAVFIHLKFSVKQLFIIVFVFLFFTSWLLTWYTLCKKEMSKQHYIIEKNMPEYCKSREKQDAGLLSVTFSWLASPFRYEKDECTEYFEHLIISPYIKVSPFEALAVTLTRFFVSPLSHIAEELSKAVRMFLKDMPVHIQPIAIIGLSVFGFLLLFMGFGYRVSSILLTIGPGEQNLAGKLQALKVKYENEKKNNKELKDKYEKKKEETKKLEGRITDLKQAVEKSQGLAISHVPDPLTSKDRGEGSSHSCSVAKSIETIPNKDCDSEVLVNTEPGVAKSKKVKDSNKTDSVNKNRASVNENGVESNKNGVESNKNGKESAINENVSAKNENGEVSDGNGDRSAIYENGAVSAINDNVEPRPVQCTDNHGIEEVNLKKSAISNTCDKKKQ